jgi:hypothetical protein
LENNKNKVAIECIRMMGKNNSGQKLQMAKECVRMKVQKVKGKLTEFQKLKGKLNVGS